MELVTTLLQPLHNRPISCLVEITWLRLALAGREVGGMPTPPLQHKLQEPGCCCAGNARLALALHMWMWIANARLRRQGWVGNALRIAPLGGPITLLLHTMEASAAPSVDAWTPTSLAAACAATRSRALAQHQARAAVAHTPRARIRGWPRAATRMCLCVSSMHASVQLSLYLVRMGRGHAPPKLIVFGKPPPRPSAKVHGPWRVGGNPAIRAGNPGIEPLRVAALHRP